MLLAGIQKEMGTNMDRQPCVYLLASQRNGTLYIGVTSNLVKRIWEHKTNVVEGFTKIYKVHALVWYEIHETMESAIHREKELKKWKVKLIESFNPGWKPSSTRWRVRSVQRLHRDRRRRGWIRRADRSWVDGDLRRPDELVALLLRIADVSVDGTEKLQWPGAVPGRKPGQL